VIDSYREHPDYITFSNALFRPAASDQISIDYQDSQSRFLYPLHSSSGKQAKIRAE
jgi:hypothetical protein